MKNISVIQKKLPFIFLFHILSCSSTVEFLPEPNFHSNYPSYSKKNFKEVEITYHKPQRPFVICGQIFVRDFQGDNDPERIIKLLQQESLERKLDGVWILNSKKEDIPPTIILGKNQKGMILSYQEIGKEVAKIHAIGFRYK